MYDIILRITDYGLRFQGQLRKTLDLKLFTLILIAFFLYGFYLNNHYLQNLLLTPSTAPTLQTTFVWPFGGYIQSMALLLIASIIFNRKFWVYVLNKRIFFTFYDSLSNRRTNEQDFLEIWNKYENLCKALERKYQFIDEGSQYDGIVLIYRRINQRFYTQSIILRRNANTGNMDDDLRYQEKVMLNSYIRAICEYVTEYNHETHTGTNEADICQKFNQIRLEQELVEIIKYCHADGYGFLSTLALENLIGISLSLPPDCRVKILEVLASASVKNIGWLNRRVFEVILIDTVFDLIPDNELNQFIENLKELDKNISDFYPRLMFDERVEFIKNEFKKDILVKYLQKKGFDYV